MRKSWNAAGVIFLLLGLIHGAFAQDEAVNQGALAAPAYLSEGSMASDFLRNETVTSRAHPETAAQGINAGGWQIFPRVGVTESYNDNIYATNSALFSDFITNVAPDVQFRTNWNNNSIALDANSSSNFYTKHTTENTTDYSVTGNGRFDITRQEYLAVRGGYSFLHEDRTSPNNSFGILPTTFGLTDGEVEYFDKFNRLSLTANGVFNKFNYNNVGNGSGGFILNTDRSRAEYTGSVRLGYELRSLLEVYVKGTGSDRSYDHKVSSDGFERSSTGYTATSGMALDMGGITFGEIGVGYMARSYQDPRFLSVSGVTASAAVTWNVTTLTTVRLSAQRSIEETIAAGSSGFVASTGSLTIDHELLRNLLLNLSGGVDYNKYQQDAGRTDLVPKASVGATYSMNRNLTLSAKYSYRNQEDSSPTLSFTQNLALVRLTLQL